MLRNGWALSARHESAPLAGAFSCLTGRRRKRNAAGFPTSAGLPLWPTTGRVQQEGHGMVRVDPPSDHPLRATNTKLYRHSSLAQRTSGFSG